MIAPATLTRPAPPRARPPAPPRPAPPRRPARRSRGTAPAPSSRRADQHRPERIETRHHHQRHEIDSIPRGAIHEDALDLDDVQDHGAAIPSHNSSTGFHVPQGNASPVDNPDTYEPRRSRRSDLSARELPSTTGSIPRSSRTPQDPTARPSPTCGKLPACHTHPPIHAGSPAAPNSAPAPPTPTPAPGKTARPDAERTASRPAAAKKHDAGRESSDDTAASATCASSPTPTKSTT